MADWLWLVPALPFAGSAVLLATRGELPRRLVAGIGVGSVGAAALVAILASAAFLHQAAPTPVRAAVGDWITVGGFSVDLSLYLDSLAVVMMLVVSVVGFLIHLYSAGYMAGDEGYSRFFSYMNLFMASMLTLVLAGNLLLLYLGWEGVGLCSYLLIGFWYQDPDNGYAARKAFVVTRVGDAAMTIGLLLLFTSLGTLDIQQLMSRAAAQWQPGSGMALTAAGLLLGGALGKSAQLPLQTWLPDAMAGPTPVSALIHAATMVTAGVYLIARTNALFVLAPAVQTTVAFIGAVTLLLAATSALTQRDIKRVLAYSTMSQIGYMFLALGVGAWSAGIFHFMTHAFFKALLFLAAGALIQALHHERDIFKMGGLRHELPGVYWPFLIGAATLSAVPLITSGFYSKDDILTAAWTAAPGGPWLWLAGLAGALLTSVYTFRVIFIAFFGREGPSAAPERRRVILIPLWILSGLSLLAGFIETPAGLGHVTLLSDFLHRSLPADGRAVGPGLEAALEAAAAAASLGGIAIAYVAFAPSKARAANPLPPWAGAVSRLWTAGWGFDWLYARCIVQPFLALTRRLSADPLDRIYDALAASAAAAWRVGSFTENGALRWYAAGMLAGVLIAVTMALAL